MASEEQIANIVKQQLAIQTETVNPVVLSFAAAQLTLGSYIFFCLPGIADIVYKLKEDQKPKLNNKISRSCRKLRFPEK